MNMAYKTLIAGMLSIVFCGTAIAHQTRHNDWSGGVSVVVTPGGQLSWSGGLTYGPMAVHAPRYIGMSAPYPAPYCRHRSHRHPEWHHPGHKHWKKHRRSHHHH